jgi:hypothetical protein
MELPRSEIAGHPDCRSCSIGRYWLLLRTALPVTSRSSRAARLNAPLPTASNAGWPRDGDVIVRRESAGGGKYTVRQAPGNVQLHASARDEAIRLARGFAIRAAVDLWYADDGPQRLLEAYRKESNS